MASEAESVRTRVSKIQPLVDHTYRHSPLKNSVLLHYFLGFHIRISLITMQINFHFHDPCYLRLKNIMGSSHIIYIYTQYLKRKYSSTTTNAGYCHTFFTCFLCIKHGVLRALAQHDPLPGLGSMMLRGVTLSLRSYSNPEYHTFPIRCCCCFLHVNRSGLNHTQ